ncbi:MULTISPECIES: hypothetical protein [unclassified Pseudomonas]|uniref:hypothetical protein n=1 Tax=unclassified Pseudomonas TaxID=196821 RepID=UPI000D3A19E3|nr:MULTISPECIES: hypothetical protein [unclassified Pseudomonas]RAU43685.1 hypothetical protein DBP26_019345 [Pseudomonas sp. RIT 409]RAU54383.1 hypothetical protein DBY65_008625 [Pseudomonas sp. RIT 412]
MNRKNGALAPTGSACLKKATTLFFVSHPKSEKPLLGPFLTAADAEYGRQVMRSPDATVTSSQAEIDHLTQWRAENNGVVVRTFAGGASHG